MLRLKAYTANGVWYCSKVCSVLSYGLLVAVHGAPFHAIVRVVSRFYSQPYTRSTYTHIAQPFHVPFCLFPFLINWLLSSLFFTSSVRSSNARYARSLRVAVELYHYLLGFLPVCVYVGRSENNNEVMRSCVCKSEKGFSAANPCETRGRQLH